METNDGNNSKEPINDDAEFENSDIDPGFLGHQEESDADQLDSENDDDSSLSQDDSKGLKGYEDERAHNIDAGLSIKEMREGKKDGDDNDNDDADALNYKNDRENGSYNPKNI
jgi:hypothetical protein